MSRKFACLYLAVALLVSSIWIASADERDTVQQEVQYSAAVEALDAAGLTSRSSNVLPSGEGLALALELGLPEEETISLSQLPTEALKTSQAQEDAARRKQADTAAAAADAAAKEAARQNLLSEYDGVQLTEAVRLRSAADNDTATSLTIDSGKVARLNDYQDGWYQVTFGQSTGYIPAEYAQPVHYADYEGTSATNTVREELIAYAYTYLGTPYVYGGSSYSGTDCSGFTMYIYKQFGYNLPHSATSQWLSGMGTKIYSISELQPGDLVFFNDPSRNKGKACSHAGIYIGNGQHVHASSSRNGGVITSDLTSGYYNTYFVGGLRLS